MNKFPILLFLIIFSLAACAPRSDNTTPEMAQRLLKLRGFDYTEEDFFKAIKGKDAPAVKLFLQAGINPNVRTKAGETVLTFAVLNSDVATLGHLVEKANLDERDQQGNTPLFLALKKRREEIFSFLLKKNANPNSTGTAGKTQNQSVLYVAVLLDRADLVQQLLEKGADPQLADNAGSVPISELVINARPNMEIFKMLLAKMTNVNVQESDGSTILIFAAKNTKLLPEKRQEIIKMLLEKGADKSIQDKNGKTALDWAKERKNKDAAELLK